MFNQHAKHVETNKTFRHFKIHFYILMKYIFLNGHYYCHYYKCIYIFSYILTLICF